MTAETSDLLYSAVDDRFQMDLENRTVLCDGQLVESFTPVQFEFAATLITKPDSVFQLSVLSRTVLGYEEDFFAKAVLRNHAKRTRRKLGRELGDPVKGAIRAKPGVGYYIVSSLAGVVEVSDSPEGISRSVADGRLVFHLDKWKMAVDDKLVDVTLNEYRVLNLLTAHPDKVIDVSAICKIIWGRDDVTNRANARLIVMRLRQKLGDDLGDVAEGALRTKAGEGYYVVSSLTNDPVRDAESEDPKYWDWK